MFNVTYYRILSLSYHFHLTLRNIVDGLSVKQL